MSKLVEIAVPQYKFNNDLNLESVSKAIDYHLLANFKGKKVVIRGIQSAKHTLPNNKLIQQIIDTGVDRYVEGSKNEVKVTDKPVDLFGYACTLEKRPVVLPILEGFHKWKPKSLERPQSRVDIWMIYDVSQLQNVEYTHKLYNVKAKDGYIFLDSGQKETALLGVIVIK